MITPGPGQTDRAGTPGYGRHSHRAVPGQADDPVDTAIVAGAAARRAGTAPRLGQRV
jgi:hypothetical protein